MPFLHATCVKIWLSIMCLNDKIKVITLACSIYLFPKSLNDFIYNYVVCYANIDVYQRKIVKLDLCYHFRLSWVIRRLDRMLTPIFPVFSLFFFHQKWQFLFFFVFVKALTLDHNYLQNCFCYAYTWKLFFACPLNGDFIVTKRWVLSNNS